MSDVSKSLYQIQWQTVNELKSLIHTLSGGKDSIYLQRIKELEAELRRLKKSKRYWLVWEDKPEDVVEKCKNELPVLIEDNSKRIVEWWDDLTHILIEWDNYHALSVLSYTHERKIDVIYIDPPYNTWAKDWKYNNDYVDSEDQFRHSKWLAMMSKRLVLSRSLLTEKWFIVLAIDHYELFSLWLLCDEIFWEENRIGVVAVVHKSEWRNQEKFFWTSHEYMMFYAKDKKKCDFQSVILDSTIQETFNMEDEKWKYRLNNYLRSWGWDQNLRINKQNSYYPIYVSADLTEITLTETHWYSAIYPITNSWQERTWKTKADTLLEALELGEIIAQRDNKWNVQIYEKYRENQIIKTHWVDPKYHAIHHWTKLIEKILWSKKFDFPKSLFLLIDILKITSMKDSIILDFFAGSGTTWHAVLELNKEDGWKRQFILCTNNENNIAEEVTYPRIRNVINGYADIEGIPGNLRYYRTDFIGVDKSIDDLRAKFMGRCTDMLQVRENTFLHFPLSKNGPKLGWEWENDYFRVFQNTEKLLVVMYHPYEIETFKKWFEFLREKEDILQKSNVPTHKEIVVYIFSMWWEIFEEELAHLSDRIRIETIPDEVLETYKKIFGF